jgi:hypothetical protein
VAATGAAAASLLPRQRRRLGATALLLLLALLGWLGWLGWAARAGLAAQARDTVVKAAEAVGWEGEAAAAPGSGWGSAAGDLGKEAAVAALSAFYVMAVAAAEVPVMAVAAAEAMVKAAAAADVASPRAGPTQRGEENAAPTDGRAAESEPKPKKKGWFPGIR